MKKEWAILDSNNSGNHGGKQGSAGVAAQNPAHFDNDDGLERVIAAWDTLPFDVRQQILELID